MVIYYSHDLEGMEVFQKMHTGKVMVGYNTKSTRGKQKESRRAEQKGDGYRGNIQ